MPHKIVAFNPSHGFQNQYWEIGQKTTAQDSEMREDADGNIIPPPHFRFEDGSSNKPKPGAQKPALKPEADKPADKPAGDKPAADKPAGVKPPKPGKGAQK